MAIETQMLESFDTYTSPEHFHGSYGKWQFGYYTYLNTTQGNKCVRFHWYAGWDSFLRTSLKPVSSIILGFSYLCDSYVYSPVDANDLFSIGAGRAESAGNAFCGVRINGVGNLQALSGRGLSASVLATSSETVELGSWEYIEARIYIHPTAGEFEVRLNGQTVINLSGIDTTNGNTDHLIQHFYFWCNDYDGTDPEENKYMTNVYIRGDDSGNGVGGFFGPVTISKLVPVSDGFYADFSKSDGGANGYTLIDEEYVNSADYLSSATPNSKSSFGFEQIPGGSVIKSVQLNIADYVLGGSREYRPFVRSAGGDYNLNSMRSSEGRLKYQVVDNDPSTGISWVLSDFNASEFGLELL